MMDFLLPAIADWLISEVREPIPVPAAEVDRRISIGTASGFPSTNRSSSPQSLDIEAAVLFAAD